MFNKASLSEQVEDALRLEITEGRVAPGQRVNLTDYQESWNVSSTPFRDAIRALEMQGFVTVEPRKGVYVAPMNLDTVKEIFELRIALECMAVELAAELVPQDKADAALDAYLRVRDLLARGDTSELGPTDRVVHDLARDHCGNRRLQRLLVSQMDLFRWAQNTIIWKMPRSYELALPEHIEIMTAVCKRDKAQAARAMRKHLENSRDRLQTRIGRQQADKKKP